MPGVLGAVAAPDCLLRCLSGGGIVESRGGNEELVRGEGCCEVRWFVGAIKH